MKKVLILLLASSMCQGCGYVSIMKIYDKTGITQERIKVISGPFDYKKGLASRQVENSTEVTYESQELSGKEKAAVTEAMVTLPLSTVIQLLASTRQPVVEPIIPPLEGIGNGKTK